MLLSHEAAMFCPAKLCPPKVFPVSGNVNKSSTFQIYHLEGLTFDIHSKKTPELYSELSAWDAQLGVQCMS